MSAPAPGTICRRTLPARPVGARSWSRAVASSGSAASATRWATASASSWKATTVRRNLGNGNGLAPSTSGSRPDLWCHGQRAVRHRCRVPWIFPYIGGGVGYAGPICRKAPPVRRASFPLISNHFDQTRRETSHSRQSVACRSRCRVFRACRSRRSTASLVCRAARLSPALRSWRVCRRLSRYSQAAAPVQPQLPARRALCLQRRVPDAGAPDPGRACARSGALLSGVLRLGQGDAHRSRAPDRQGGGRQLHPRPVHTHRGERLHRHLGRASSTTRASRSAAPGRCRPN